MFDVVTYYLRNGMRVMLHREKGSRVVKVGVVVNQGSMHEKDDNNGISHFLEHMIFAQYEDDEHIRHFRDELRYYGAYTNATTYKANTMYYVSGLAEGINVYLTLLRDLVFKAKPFTEETLARERDVVTRELVSFYSSFNQINDRSIQALYGKNNIGRIIIGKKRNVANFQIEDLTKAYQSSYVPGNAAIVVFGDIDYYEVENIINELYEPLDDRTLEQNLYPVLQSPSFFFNSSYKGENAIISVCHRFVTNENPILAENSIMVLLCAMGDPMLCQKAAYELRLKTGLAYKVGGFSKNMNPLYAAGINATARTKDIPEVTKIIWENYCYIREYGFTADELDRIKKNIVYRKLAEKGNMSTQAEALLHMAMNPFIYSPENEIRTIENLTLEEVNRQVNQLLQPVNFGLAGIGSFDLYGTVNQLTI